MARLPGCQAGMTLVEVVVVIAIVALTAVGVLPVAGRALNDATARTATEQVVVALRLARQNALSAAASYRVAIETDAVRVACLPGIPAGNRCPANRPPDSSEPVREGVSVVPSVNPVIFGPTGSATAATIRLSSPDGLSWEVSVNASGRIRSCRPVCP
jgi:prepilin-type N-terminal cleavage/methylation domain-containing protein